MKKTLVIQGITIVITEDSVLYTYGTMSILVLENSVTISGKKASITLLPGKTLFISGVLLNTYQGHSDNKIVFTDHRKSIVTWRFMDMLVGKGNSLLFDVFDVTGWVEAKDA